MDATPIPATPTPARDRQALRTLGFLALLLAAATGGFFAGRFSAPVDDAGKAEAAACTSVQASALTAYEEAKNSHPSGNSGPDPIKVRYFANMVVQNGPCFTPQQRAEAQTVLDQLNQAGQ